MYTQLLMPHCFIPIIFLTPTYSQELRWDWCLGEATTASPYLVSPFRDTGISESKSPQGNEVRMLWEVLYFLWTVNSLSNQLFPGVQSAGFKDIFVLQFDFLDLCYVHAVTCPQKNKDATEEAWMSFILYEPGKHRALHPHLYLC